MPFGLEPGQHRLGVYAGLDDLDRDGALDRLGLLGHVDAAHVAFANRVTESVGQIRKRLTKGKNELLETFNASRPPRYEWYVLDVVAGEQFIE